MTKIKLCGIRKASEIIAVNELRPEYIGFVFAQKSKRCITPEQAMDLRHLLLPGISAVGVFVNETPDVIAGLLNKGIINFAQLHGSEDEYYLSTLRGLTDKPLIQAFKIREPKDLEPAEKSTADMILLDAGAGSGTVFDWNLLNGFSRPFFLAGGLDPENVQEAVQRFHPYAVDVSSGIETDGAKDLKKMTAFVRAVRELQTKGKTNL